jgi:hypothetical protein
MAAVNLIAAILHSMRMDAEGQAASLQKPLVAMKNSYPPYVMKEHHTS